MAYSRDQFNQFAEEQLLSPPADFPWAPAVGIGLPVGGFLAGFMRTKSGKRVWDYYFTSLRHLEGTIPLGMFQTFHLSEAISPFAAPEKLSLLASQHPELFKSRGFRDYLSHTTGLRISELEKLGAFKKGLSWKRTGSVLGELKVQGGKVLATDVAAVSTGARRGGFLIEWLGHVMGVKNPAFLKGIKETANEMKPDWLFAAGGRTKAPAAKTIGRFGYAVVSSAVGRMNQLLKSPFELELVEDWVKKAPALKWLDLGVKPGPAHSMLWRYTKKGALAFAAYKALDYGDYLGREHGVAATLPLGIAGGAVAGAAVGLKQRGLVGRYAAIGAVAGGVLGLSGEGPLSTLAATYAKVRVGQAEVAEATGLGAGARRTEDYFPGLTSPATLVASGALGLLLGGTYDWRNRLELLRAASSGGKGPKAGAARARGIYEQVDEAVKRRREKLYKFHQSRAAKQTGWSKIVSEFRARYHGGIKKGKFRAAGAGRTAMLAIAGYEALNIAGSAVAGDVPGALFQTAALAGAGYAYARKGGALGLGILLVSHLMREKEDPKKLERVYRGEEKIPIRSGRYWEAGRTPYKGKRPYYRPHRVALIRSGADKAAIYGSEENYWESDPMLNPIDFLLNPYAREELMWEQGYKFPVSRTPFEDTPVLGPILAATIGRILKPPKYMGRDQWLPERLQEGPAGMMEVQGSEPIMRTGIKGTIGEQIYRGTELIGIPGFAIQSLKEALTGKESFFEENQWATPSLVSGAEPTWWSTEMGGLGLLSEPLRRYVPHRRCLLPDSIVKTRRGNIPIQEVQPGDKVVDLRGNYTSVLEKTSRFVDEPVISLRTYYNNEALLLTADHCVRAIRVRYCTARGKKSNSPCYHNERKECCRCPHKDSSFPSATWIPAGSVSSLDFVQIPTPIQVVPARKILSAELINQYVDDDGKFVRTVKLCRGKKNSIRRSYSRTKVSSQIELNYNFGWLLGLYAAEGNVNQDAYVNFSLHREEVVLANRIVEVIKSVINFGKTKCFSQTHKWTDKKGDCLVQTCASVPFALLVKELIPGTAVSKRINPILKKAPEEFLKGVLDGYIEGDGCVSLSQNALRVISSSASRDLNEDIFEIAVVLGYLPNRGKRKRGKSFVNSPSIYYTLDFSGSEAVEISSRLFKGQDKYNKVTTRRSRRRIIRKDGAVFVGVKSIDYQEYSGQVYNLEVDITQSYGTNVCIVHNSQIEYKNPLPSGLPSWLPGESSQYFLDFSRAEIYTQIKEPWYRLPGPGLSVLNPELQGVDPEYYSNYWRFKVLSDVAPWSKEFGQYNRMMSQAMADNRLTAEQMLEVQSIRKQVADVKKAKRFQQYRYDAEAVERKTVRVTEELEPGVYLTDSLGSAPITLAGVDTSTLSLASVARVKDSSLTARQAMRAGMARRVQASDFLRDYIYPGAEVEVFVHKDPSGLMERGPGGRPQVPAVVSVGGLNINRELVEQGLAESLAESEGKALDPMMATSGAQRMFGRFWENLTHGAETPIESFTPLAPIAKFVHQRTALEEYQRSEVYGREVSMWNKPFDHFIAPGLTTTAWWAGWRGLPRKVQERYMVEEYFDRLEHMKWMRLQDAAKADGDAKLAAQYLRQARRTKTGVNKFSPHSARLSLSSKEGVYFQEFVESPTAAERREISQMVSPQMRQILHAQWAKRASEGARMRQEAGLGRDGDLASIARFDALSGSYAQEQRQQEATRVVAEMPVPGPNWVGWDRHAEVEDYKVKTILDKEMDASAFGVWRSDIRRVARRPWVQSLAFDEPSRQMISTGAMHRSFNGYTGMMGHRPPRVYPRASGNGRINIDSPGYDKLDRYRRDPNIMTF